MPITKKHAALILFAIMTFTVSTSSFSKSDKISHYEEDSISIFIVKAYWHTGIRIKINDESCRLIPAVKDFKQFNFIDIGWGDEEFYQNAEFEIELAAKAILVPSPSVLRFAGIYTDVNEFINWVDFCVEIKISSGQLIKLTEFITDSFLLNEDGKPIAASKRANGQIIFYKSILKYHLFNTCNTWVADALEYSGLDISTAGIITAEQLFDEIYELGIVLKPILD